MINLQVLVCDDEFGMRIGIERSLRNFTLPLKELSSDVGFSITTVASGEEAVEKLKYQPFDILILDHKLPGIQGIEVLHIANELENKPLTIIATAFATIDAAISATKNGAFDFISKPFTPEELRSRITKAAKSIILLRKAKQLEQEKRQVRFQFISVLGHELKAPLAAVEGYLDIMKSRAVGEDIASYETMIDRSIIRLTGMRKMILDLLDLTRLESGNKVRTFEDIDMVEQAQGSLDSVALDCRERKITITLHVPDALPFRADSVEMQIVLNNLVTNSVKYNKDGGTVDLYLSPLENGVQIICKDSGIGMSEQDLKGLFKEFSRVKNEKTKNVLGSGLGLSILQKISDLYNGSIDVTSAEDVGTTFSLTLFNADD
ncbi:MAG: hybrid sensor histidine kinase/response regulator [Fibrobacterales bacterium]